MQKGHFCHKVISTRLSDKDCMNNTPYTPNANLLDQLLDAICVVDREGRFVFVSAACEQIFGYSPDEMMGRVMIDMVHPDDRARTLDAATRIMAGTQEPHFENRYLRKDGQVVHILWSARWSADDQVRVAVAHDITERKRNEALKTVLYGISEATHYAKDLPSLFAQVRHIVIELLPTIEFYVALIDERSSSLHFPYPPADTAATVKRWPSEVLSLCQEVIGSAAAVFRPARGDRDSTEQDAFWLGLALKSDKGIIGALLAHNTAPSRHSRHDVELLQFVSTQVATAIERQQMLSRLHFMAQYDTLTQLPNRALLHDRLHTALARARREQAWLALLFIDLDKFKQVNDTYGHTAGDQLLQAVAQRIQQCVREVDTVARFAGDEFVVLLEDFQQADHATAVAEKIRHALNQPFVLCGQAQYVSPSIGIALYPEHAADEHELLQLADQAMYRAKQTGGNRLCHAPLTD